MIFLMYVATIQNLSTVDRNMNKNLKSQFAVYISDTPVTLKQRQGHQIYNENFVTKQGYNHAKFERSRFSGV